MRTRIGTVAVDISRAEASRFVHPLLLLHGLWTGGWMWQPLAGFLAHRGWEVWAPSLLEEGPAPDHDARLAQLALVARAAPAVPILVAHDVAVVTAAVLGATIGTPATVAVAPLVAPADAGGARGLFSWPSAWAARLGGARVRPPRSGHRLAALGLGPGARARLRPDSGAVFRALASGRTRLPASVSWPGLVIVGDADPVTTPAAAALVATRLGWEHRVYPGSRHFPMLEAGWERLATELHRWLVQALGAPLLAMLEDEEDA